MENDHEGPQSHVVRGSPSIDSTWKTARPDGSMPPLLARARTPQHGESPASLRASSGGTALSHAETFFEPLDIKHGLSERLLKRLVLILETLDLHPGCISLSIDC